MSREIRSWKLLFSFDAEVSEAERWGSEGTQRETKLSELTAFTMFQILCGLPSTKVPPGSKTSRLKHSRRCKPEKCIITKEKVNSGVLQIGLNKQSKEIDLIR